MFDHLIYVHMAYELMNQSITYPPSLDSCLFV